MDDLRFGAAVRAARVRRGWRQVDVAELAGVSDSTVSRLERGIVSTFQLRTIRAIAAVLEVSVEMQARSRAASFERVANQAHAALADRVVAWIDGVGGWQLRPEVSFSRFGDRGVVDLVGWHAGSRALLIIELKTEIVDVGELLGTLHKKGRNGREIASGLGWSPMTVSALLVISDSSFNRRRIGTNASTFHAALPARMPEVRRWLHLPGAGAAEGLRGLMFFANRHPRQPNERLTVVRRVRRSSRRVVPPIHA